MRIAVGLGKENVEARLERQGVSRRDFLKFCSMVAVTMGMGTGFAEQVARALTMPRRPSVVYLHNAECTGCSEALLRTGQPFIDELILDTISLDYHETIMAAAGEAAEAALEQAISAPEGFICVVEGAIPTANEGKYGYIAGHTMLDICGRILPKAKAVVAYGTCAAFGGVQAAKPNPTGAQGVNECFGAKGIKAINIGGCPPNPLNLVGTLVAFLRGDNIELDANNRPMMFYGSSVHDQCERREHFDNGEFAPSFDSEEARNGWCLYELGCKGPDTMNNSRRSNSTGPTGPWARDIRASAAASPVSGTNCPRSMKTRGSTHERSQKNTPEPFHRTCRHRSPDPYRRPPAH